MPFQTCLPGASRWDGSHAALGRGGLVRWGMDGDAGHAVVFLDR